MALSVSCHSLSSGSGKQTTNKTPNLNTARLIVDFINSIDPKRTFGGSFGCGDIGALRDLGQGRSAVTPIASDYEAIGPRTVFICGIDQSYSGRTKSPAQN